MCPSLRCSVWVVHGIVVDLPGIQDSARAKEILNKFANLEFRLAALPNTPRFQRETYEYEGRAAGHSAPQYRNG